MAVEYEALSGGGRLATARLSANSKRQAVPIGQKIPKGCAFCESCRSYKPGPSNRRKGWKCKDCRARTGIKLLEAVEAVKL